MRQQHVGKRVWSRHKTIKGNNLTVMGLLGVLGDFTEMGAMLRKVFLKVCAGIDRRRRERKLVCTLKTEESSVCEERREAGFMKQKE